MIKHYLSAAVITRNEERNIERCLNSLVGVVDEIVVVDSLSEDATVDICRRYGARVVTRPFTGYGSQRQYAATLASGNYVLSIDADEVLTDELRENLKALKTRGFDHRMYSFEVVNYICGRRMDHSGLRPVSEIRLFDKRYANWDLLDVGERLTYPSGVLPEPLAGAMHHYRSDSLEEFEKKEMRHAALRARLLAAAGISASKPMCWLRGAAAYLRCGISDGAFLDGATGRRIAAIRAKAAVAAYEAARRINRPAARPEANTDAGK